MHRRQRRRFEPRRYSTPVLVVNDGENVSKRCWQLVMNLTGNRSRVRSQLWLPRAAHIVYAVLGRVTRPVGCRPKSATRSHHCTRIRSTVLMINTGKPSVSNPPAHTVLPLGSRRNDQCSGGTPRGVVVATLPRVAQCCLTSRTAVTIIRPICTAIRHTCSAHAGRTVCNRNCLTCGLSRA